MGDAVRVENVRPIAVQGPAALPEPAVRETIEPPAAREAEVVPVAKPEAPAKRLIVDESTTPDTPAEPVAALPDWAATALSEYATTGEKMPKALYDRIVAAIRDLPTGGKERVEASKRLKALGHAPEVQTREPGQEG